MWVEEAAGIPSPVWDLDSFAGYGLAGLDTVRRLPEEGLYSCVFSDGADRYGYIVFRYDAHSPSIQNLGVTETSPRRYDLQANLEEIAGSLAQTELDLSATAAARVLWYDREGRSGEQGILFRDSGGRAYLCRLGDEFLPPRSNRITQYDLPPITAAGNRGEIVEKAAPPADIL